jgi:hypothetical protein
MIDLMLPLPGLSAVSGKKGSWKYLGLCYPKQAIFEPRLFGR